MTLGADAIVQGTAQSDPAGYRRGEAPQPLAVQRPRGASLLAMSDVERKEMAWQFLSTTQGRTTAIATIRTLIAQHLTKKGFVVEERDYDPKATRVQPLAFKEWSVHMSGPGGTQPAFAVVDALVACSSEFVERELLVRLLRLLQTEHVRLLRLQPLLDPGQSNVQRVHVPGGDPHGAAPASTITKRSCASQAS